MNKIYKVVKCRTTGEYKAVPEFAKSAGKGKGLGKKLAAVSLVAVVGMAAAQAGEVGGAAVNSTATGGHAVVVGGDSNTASGLDSFIGAGKDNEISYTATSSGIVSGLSNTVSDQYSAILGGFENSVLGSGSAIGAGNNSMV